MSVGGRGSNVSWPCDLEDCYKQMLNVDIKTIFVWVQMGASLGISLQLNQRREGNLQAVTPNCYCS